MHTSEPACPKCTRRFKSISEMCRHFFRLHKKAAWDCCKCPFCSSLFATTGCMTRHVKEQHNIFKALYKCSNCTKRFSREENLKRHHQIHHEEYDRPQCEICQKSFSQRASLNRHMQRAHEGKEFSCISCSATFSRKEYLRQH